MSLYTPRLHGSSLSDGFSARALLQGMLDFEAAAAIRLLSGGTAG